MRFANSILLLATASLAFAFDAVISKGLWIGTDSTKPGVSLEKIFADRRNHVTATSSLLQYYGSDNSYVPRDMIPAKGMNSYDAFKASVQNSPAFIDVTESKVQMYADTDLEKLQEAIRSAYPYQQDGSLVALNLVSSIPSKSLTLRGTQVVLFSLVEVFKPSKQETVEVRLIELPIVLVVDDQGHVELLGHLTQLTVLTYKVDSEWLHESAPLLAEYVKKATTVKEFVQIFTTLDEDEEEDEFTQWVSSNRRLYRNFPIAF
ncbi:hypothetical protein DFQ26_004643 [Actinomortierella ambigua]|nr:hypothetical protein DFQ26_004643 [Actinomortierella ambigua]